MAIFLHSYFPGLAKRLIVDTNSFLCYYFLAISYISIPANQDHGSQPPQKNTIELEGKVIETLPNAVFRVQIESGQVILAHIAGKLRVNKIRVLPGDKVIVEVTPYDLTRGRVIRRLR